MVHTAEFGSLSDPSRCVAAEGRYISRQHLYDILRERKPVSPAIAVRLGKLFGDGAGVWVRMQAAYDTWNAERRIVTSFPSFLPAKS